MYIQSYLYIPKIYHILTDLIIVPLGVKRQNPKTRQYRDNTHENDKKEGYKKEKAQRGNKFTYLRRHKNWSTYRFSMLKRCCTW
jgi:hypothetical protein